MLKSLDVKLLVFFQKQLTDVDVTDVLTDAGLVIKASDIIPSANDTLTNNAGLMLAQRRRRCANIRPAFGQRVVFVG